MGEALHLAGLHLADDAQRIAALRDRLWQGVAHLAGVHRNGDAERIVPGILNIRIDQVDGEALIMALREVALSSGSACASSRREPSYVLGAMGLNPAQVDGSLRCSLGRFTTPDEIERTIELLCLTVPRLRDLQRDRQVADGTPAVSAGQPGQRARGT
jgi:cysteine desulfurase